MEIELHSLIYNLFHLCCNLLYVKFPIFSTRKVLSPTVNCGMMFYVCGLVKSMSSINMNISKFLESFQIPKGHQKRSFLVHLKMTACAVKPHL